MKHATQLIDQVVAERLRVKSEFFQEHKDRIVEVAENIAHGLRNGNKVLFFGNGGSAADAQHLAAEFVGRFGPDRSPLAGISLSTDTSILTALSNDYGYEKVFSRQIEALGRPGDTAIAISTSGNSPNPIKPLDFQGISTYPLQTRKSKVHAEMFGKAMDGSENILGFVSKLPHILAGDNLRSLIRAVLYAYSSRKPIIWGLGGHVIKVGLGPVIVDLMKSGFVTGIAMNGSAAIHDFEVVLGGAPSEEFEEQIGEC